MSVTLVTPAIFAEVIVPHDPLLTSLDAQSMPSVWQHGGSSEYLLGADKLGRDVLSRLIYGGPVALTVALLTVAISALRGAAIALLSVRLPARVDAALARIGRIV